MSFEGLQERLAALQETTSQVRELIDRLAELKFQPGSVPLGADEEDSVSGELNAEIGQLLRSGLEDQELLQEEVKYLRPEGHDKERLQDSVSRVGHELSSYRIAFRKARIAAKKRLVEAQKLERQLILKSYSAPIDEPDDEDNGDGADDIEQAAPRYTRQPQHQQYHSSLSEEDKQTVGASSNVTNALRRTHDLIAAELSRSEFAHETLTESSAALKELNESYGSLDSMLSKSRDLLGTLLRSQKSDTWYLQTAFYMLLTTAAWLVFRRLLYGPVWWIVLFPLRVLFGVGSTATRAVLPAGRSAAPSSKADVNNGQQNVLVEGMPSEDVPTAQVGTDKGPDEAEPGVMEEIENVVEAAVGEGGQGNERSGNDDEQDGASEKAMKGVKDTIQRAAEAVVGDGEGDSGQEMEEMGEVEKSDIPEKAEEGLKEGIQHAAEAVIGDTVVDSPQEGDGTDGTQQEKGDAPEEAQGDAKDSVIDTAERVVEAIAGDGEGDSGQEVEEMGDVDDKGDAPKLATEGLKDGAEKVAEAVAGDAEGGSGQERDEL